MQITVQGSGRRVKFTKSECKLLKAASTLLGQIGDVTRTDDAVKAANHVDCILGDIDESGEFKRSEKAKEKPDA